MKKILSAVRWLAQDIQTGVHKGSNHASLRLRKYLEKLNIRQFIGVNLAGLAFFSAIVIPQIDTAFDSVEVILETQTAPVEASSDTVTAMQWPLSRFGLSQRFSYGHPGIDLTAPLGTAVFPVDKGTVENVVSSRWGYGNHVVVTHGNSVASLYAHLSAIDVVRGQEVTRATKIGSVGSTGWSTGNHLHLEIYRDGTPVNPLETLPSIK